MRYDKDGYGWQAQMECTLCLQIDEENLQDGHSAVGNQLDTSNDSGDTHDMTFLDNAKIATLEKMGALLLSWERKYHMLWDQDKDVFIR